jgi:hypothetical protein
MQRIFPLSLALWVYAGVGAHGGAPNVVAPPRLCGCMRGQGGKILPTTGMR